MYAKYFTVYFRRTIKFDARVANLILYYSNVNVLRNDNNVARVKSKRIETSICSIINIKLSTPIFGRPMTKLYSYKNAFYTCFTKEIILKQLFASGSVIMVNIHLDFVSVNIHQ